MVGMGSEERVQALALRPPEAADERTEDADAEEQPGGGQQGTDDDEVGGVRHVVFK